MIYLGMQPDLQSQQYKYFLSDCNMPKLLKVQNCPMKYGTAPVGLKIQGSLNK
jgi:hypothetical protein